MCAKRGSEVTKEELDAATAGAKECRIPIDFAEIALELTGRFGKDKVVRGGELPEIRLVDE